MTRQQRNERINIRNFLIVATREELEKELSLCQGNPVWDFKAECIKELIREWDAEQFPKGRE